MKDESNAGALRSLRVRNRAQVVDVLRRRGTASRAEIARRTGLSRSTVSSLVSDLQTSGLVVERADGVAAGDRGGRPPVLLALAPKAGAAVGIDFGHTHVRVAVSDLSSQVVAERHVRLDVDQAAEEALDAADALARELLAEAGMPIERVVGAGMGLPGPVDAATGIVGSARILPGWTGLRPAHELEQRLGVPVDLDNDANLGALGEVSQGVGRGARDAVYLKLASGIGSGIVIGGRIHRGVSGIAGEIGHFLADPEGSICRCGNRGCLETVAAAPALLELLRRSHGADLDIPGLLQLAADGDVGCRRALGDAGRALGRALAAVINCLNPEMLIIGGELSAAGEPLLEGIRESVRRFALPAAADAVTVTAGVLGNRAEVLGALALVIGDTERLSSVRLSAV